MNIKRYTALSLTCILSGIIAFFSQMVTYKVLHSILSKEYGIKALPLMIFCFGIFVLSMIGLTIYNIKYHISPWKALDKKTGIKSIIAFILFYLFSIILIALTKYVYSYGYVDAEQLLYCFISGTDGMDNGVITSIAYPVLTWALIYLVYFSLIWATVCNLVKAREMHKGNFLNRHSLLKKLPSVVSIISVLLIIAHTCYTIPVLDFVYYQISKPSTFISDNYVAPDSINISVPENKRNLIHVYMESMENSFADVENGGIMEENIIPNITRLSKENINFSNTDKLGGPLETYGMTYTTAGMVAYAFGIPLKIASNGTLARMNALLPELHSIYDVLYENGYKNYGIMGSNSLFGGKAALYNSHGDVTIYDYPYYVNNGSIPEDYFVFWGFEDSKLYDFAKQELTSIAQNDEPFCFVMETVDTHAPDGYTCSKCENKFNSNYKNVIACSDKQIGEFVEWAQQQDWYENTTIVITGDHLTMKQDFFINSDSNYVRTTTNIIINPAPTLEYDESVLNNRIYNGADLFPTILASLGYEIEGNQLGLGVNLFSGEKTLCEQYGYEYINNEYKKKSSFFANAFY